MPARLVRASGLFPDTGYAYAAVAPSGSLVFAAGACPIDEAGEVVGGSDYAAQARQMMANLVKALAAAGARLDDVLKTTVYVASADQADLVTVWNVVHDAFGGHEPPSTLLGVAALGYTGQLAEIEAVALVGQQAPAARDQSAPSDLAGRERFSGRHEPPGA